MQDWEIISRIEAGIEGAITEASRPWQHESIGYSRDQIRKAGKMALDTMPFTDALRLVLKHSMAP